MILIFGKGDELRKGTATWVASYLTSRASSCKQEAVAARGAIHWTCIQKGEVQKGSSQISRFEGSATCLKPAVEYQFSSDTRNTRTALELRHQSFSPRASRLKHCGWKLSCKHNKAFWLVSLVSVLCQGFPSPCYTYLDEDCPCQAKSRTD